MRFSEISSATVASSTPEAQQEPELINSCDHDLYHYKNEHTTTW